MTGDDRHTGVPESWRPIRKRPAIRSTHATSEALLGPQPRSGDEFTRRMRIHQSWWRAFVLREEPGFGPTRTSETPLGNMLNPAAAHAGRNFLTEEIAIAVEQRIARGAGVEPFRMRHNLLSSQPMCANLFGPLLTETCSAHLKAQLVGAVVPAEIETVLDAQLEHAEPALLHDRSTFDFSSTALDQNGAPVFAGIETKLTEPFSQRTYEAAKYLKLAAASPNVWGARPDTALCLSGWAQLFRNHLLAARYAETHDIPNWYSMVVLHPSDQRGCAAVDKYRSLLVDTSTLVVATLDSIVESWRSIVAADDELDRWIKLFELRYLRLELSDAFSVEFDERARHPIGPLGRGSRLRRG